VEFEARAYMSGDPEQEYFADGMVEEIITALSRFKWLFVIARNSSFTFKVQAVDVKEVGRRLGVRYVLEGSVRKASGKVRITGQLIDAVTGTHIWADRFERDLESITSESHNARDWSYGGVCGDLPAASTQQGGRRLLSQFGPRQRVGGDHARQHQKHDRHDPRRDCRQKEHPVLVGRIQHPLAGLQDLVDITPHTPTLN
jgi:hypothetical protein